MIQKQSCRTYSGDQNELLERKENNITKPQQVVVCAACRNGDIIIAGARHFDQLMRLLILALDKSKLENKEWEQGFIDQFGDFLTRQEAMKIAIAAG